MEEGNNLDGKGIFNEMLQDGWYIVRRGTSCREQLYSLEAKEEHDIHEPQGKKLSLIHI